jgi:hypothetical protein
MMSIEKILNDGTRSFGPAMFSILGFGFWVLCFVYADEISVIHYLDNNYIM